MRSIDTNSTTQIQDGLENGISLNPYAMFRFSTRSEVTRKYYERRIRQFFDFVKFDLENKADLEQTMGHNIGISSSYYKPTEQEVLKDYLNAVPLLTVNDDGSTLKKQLQELENKSKDSEYIIKGKLEEKDHQIRELVLRQEEMEKKFQLIFAKIDKTRLE